MKIRRAVWTMAMVASLLLSRGIGRAASGAQCILDARHTYVDCKAGCTSDFLDAKALCRGVSPGCFAACSDGRAECLTAARLPLTTCLDGCQNTLKQERQSCKATCGCGGTTNPCTSDSCFIACMDPFQLDAFVCRDGCRDTFRLDTVAQQALKACAIGFKACAQACPPASPSGAFLEQ